MRRAYIVYILMATLLAAGLWVVLTFGGSLRAPDDLSGEWTVLWDKPPPKFPSKGHMHVDQSGRFFTIRFENGPTLKLKLQENWKGAREGRYLSMTLEGVEWTLVCAGSIPINQPQKPDDLRLELRGATTHSGIASRASNGLAAVTQPAGTAHAR